MSEINRRNSDDPNDDLASRLMNALAHPVRRRILESLMQEPASATTIAQLFGMKLANVSYHLADVLGRQCEVVTVIEEHKRRGALEKVYALKSDTYIGVIEWPAIPEPLRSGVRGLALSSFLKFAIAALETESSNPEANNVYRWQSVAVDDDGRREICEALETLAEKVNAVDSRCADLPPETLIPLIVGNTAFEPAPLPHSGERLSKLLAP